jgi:hypothetical protein
VLFARAQNKAPVQDKYLQHQRLLNITLKNKAGISSDDYRNLYNDISSFYFKQKQFDSALFYKNEISKIIDSIYKSELDEHLRFENKRIELLEKDYQNQVKATQQQQYLSSLKKRNLILLCSVVILFILGLLFFLYFEDYKVKLRKEKLQDEVDFLKAQLNPHFLFNSLNNIYVLLDHDKIKARELLVQFCELMRYQLYDCEATTIRLSDELSFLENYVNFEKLSYHGKINVEHNLKEPVTPELYIAPILLQPFIENAFKYSPKNEHHPGDIKIQVGLTDHHFFLDLKSLADLKGQSAQYGDVGLENVKKRLQLLYPGKHELKINTIDEFFQVHLIIELSS